MTTAGTGASVPVRAAAVLLVAGLVGLSPAASQDPGQQVVTTLTLFAGTSGGLWRSRDWGGKWERVLGKSAGDSIADVGAVYGVLPIGRGVYLAAEKGLFLSDDYGETWKKLGLDVPIRHVLPSRYPGADPTVFVGTVEGLFKSVDAGRTFAPTVIRGTTVTRIEWPGPALIVTTAHAVLVSMDGGASFSSGTGLPAGPPLALAVSSFFARDPVLFTAVGAGGVYRSADGGQTWMPAGLEGHRVNDLVWLGPILFAATDDGVFRSDNGGQKWTPMAGLAARPATQIIFPLEPDSGLEVFLATEDGIVHSADGGAHWKAAGAPDDQVLCLATFPLPLRGEMRKRG
jgi:ligand-binding sensor domain-containing protein